MTTRRDEASFRVGADFSDVFSGLRRVDRELRGTGRRLGNLGGGIGGRAARGVGGVGRGLGGAGRIGLAGAGVGAGFAIVEQLLESLFEKFEGTDLLQNFTDALDLIFDAVGPLAGVIIGTLTQPLRQLAPILGRLAEALAPIIRLIGGLLLTAFVALEPILIPLITLLGQLTAEIERLVFGVLARIPGLDLDPISASTFENARGQLAGARAAEAAGAAPPVAVTAVINLDGETVQRITGRASISNSESGG